MQKGIDKGDDKSIRKGWTILNRNSSRLKDLVLDMLAYSKPREPVYEPVEGSSIPRDVVDFLQDKASEKGVTLRLAPDDHMGEADLDARAMYRAVLNLVTNAIDACPEHGGMVEVRTEHLPEEERFRIDVQDNGCGISEEDLPKMGKAFFSTKGSKGTGLGLSVTFKIVSEHCGEVKIDSAPGKGTTSSLVLPVRRPPSP